MKIKHLLILAVTIFLLISCGSTEISRSHFKSSIHGKKKIALVNVNVNTKYTEASTRRNITAEYEIILKQNGYTIIDREIIEKAIQENKLPVDREYSTSEIAKLSEKVNADILVQGFVSEASESLVSDEHTINFHFKYYSNNGVYVGETLYQYRGGDTVLDPKLVNKALINMLRPFGIKK